MAFCSKRYPKPFRPQTTFDQEGYPLYQRRDNGITVWKNNVQLDNRWVVPHNLAVLKKYQAHINVEACNKTYLIKYLFKYVNKGPDRAKVKQYAPSTDTHTQSVPNHTASNENESQAGGVDEIAEYMKSRYLSCCEAIWRLFGFEIHGKFPPVERLYVHLPGMNFITVREDTNLGDIVDDEASQMSSLTQWFVANQQSSSGHDLTYCQFPNRYTWDGTSKLWTVRRRGFKLGRLRYVHPSAGETFFLWMLLMVVKGAKNYEDVRTHAGILYPTFREACQARGLIGDDTEWSFIFDEAVLWATPYQLRNLFMTILVYCEVGNVRALFDRYWKYMADDITYRLRVAIDNPSYVPLDIVLQAALMKELAHMFCNNGLSIATYDLPQIDNALADASGNRLILEELSYDKTQLAIDSANMQMQLNQEQRHIYNLVIEAIHSRQSFAYFISGHGGTGKTFLWTAILATLRSQDHIVIAVASCGVASLLLPGGRTAHSRFKIPLDIHENSLCAIGRGTMLAGLLARASLIIWDEAPMSHRYCFEALDRSLHDILSVDDPTKASQLFGGKPILFGGDFR